MDLMRRLPDDLIRELARIDETLEPLPTPRYKDTAEQDAVAARCRASLLEWCTEALRPQQMKPARHHRILIEHLQALADGQIERLMIFLPPGAAKSLYTSQLFPAWLLQYVPDEPIIVASHTRGLAMRFSAQVQRYIRAYGEILGYGLATEAKERWETTNGGEYLAAGVGGALPGYRARFGIVDDPFKGREDADSENTREKVWNWWNADLVPRLKPRAGLVLMHTRYGEDDQAGRLLSVEPEKWTVVKFPAVAVSVNDPVGRQIGEPLWDDDDYGYGALMLRTRADLEKKGATREWQSQYQQEPRPAEGALFKTAKIQVLDVMPELRGAIIGRRLGPGGDQANRHAIRIGQWASWWHDLSAGYMWCSTCFATAAGRMRLTPGSRTRPTRIERATVRASSNAPRGPGPGRQRRRPLAITRLLPGTSSRHRARPATRPREPPDQPGKRRVTSRLSQRNGIGHFLMRSARSHRE